MSTEPPVRLPVNTVVVEAGRVAISFVVTPADRAARRRMGLRARALLLRVLNLARQAIPVLFLGLVILTWATARWDALDVLPYGVILGLWWFLLTKVTAHFEGIKEYKATREVSAEGIRVSEDHDDPVMVPWIAVRAVCEEVGYVGIVADQHQVYEIPKRFLDEKQLERLRALIPADLRGQLQGAGHRAALE